MSVKKGDVLRASRTFTVEDVEAFTRISGDRGAQHVQKDAAGRLMVHGLLTASVVTEVGGSIDYIARVMHLEYLRPVFSGDTVEAVCTIEDAVDSRLTVGIVCKNQHDKIVLQGSTSGVVR